jgi:GTP-binding protein
LVHVLDLDPATGRDPVADYDQLNAELAAYSEEVARRPQVIVANKIDLPETAENLERVREELGRRGLSVMPISAKEGLGVAELVDAIDARLREMDSAAAAEAK